MSETAIDLKKIISQVKSTTTVGDLEDLRIKFLGRQGTLTAQLRAIGNLPPEQRKTAGAEANKVRIALSEAFSEQLKILNKKSFDRQIERNVVDITAPVGKGRIGHLHPVTQLMDELVEIFWQMGYQIAEGPEVETEWYNFEALNIPESHPARDMQDTFYLEGGNLPRTHTSGIQIRYMEKHEPPIRIIAPGKVYRNEDEDPRHSWIFYQIEGLVVDEDITLGDLKGTLLAMLRGLLGDDTQLRLRPSFFPYTEPSVEMDATCVICHGKGCKMCSGTGWLELGGAGMVHPQVLRNAGIDPDKYSGFAFGFGPERIAALKYGVPDLREFWRPNLKFLEQF